MDEKIKIIHPGEVLLEDFLKPMKISAYKLSKEIHIDQTRISEIIKGKRGITVDTALRLSKFFGNSVEFWLNLQTHYEIEKVKDKMDFILNEIHTYTYTDNCVNVAG
ncbi:MAG: addiction module antidote protein, HigA family [Spirochaetes bacterium GWD1_27_9]|nr:MAG: addiction module antidote protein, HigA family [Spirochaetes bacterium GWB1_27_13]OHD24024.1 MAG: addiction module antidote protein, HigA family [Spirochaetes bacterium GWC1_27_15]OHD43954.1 MAG: addiction module antidote protein, HigA family [Spirochaetes bacterium GWD1_27_9]